MKAILYHNQNCSKSCATLEKLQELNADFKVIEYLETPPSAETLRQIVSMLGMRPEELARKGEPACLAHFTGKELSDEAWIQAMVDFPELIERPIVVRGNKAAIGRPLERVIELFKPA